ncbi:histidine kinase, partial [Micromonospora sp. M42]|uniref:histidine kinase n=1 Tax=Micromonospora sp. M42 TaxID=457406 RepID=UPI001CB78E15
MEPRERQRRAGDLLLWAVLAAPVAYGRLTPPWHADELPPLAAALALLGTAVWIGRRWPLVAVLAVVAGSLVDGNVVFAIPVFGYLAGRRSDRAAPAAAVFAAIAVTGSVLNLGLLGTEPSTWFLLSSVLLFAGVFPWLLGRLRRQHRALADAGLRHTQAERRAEVERVRLRERARIAQDMHDSLGHDLSLIALRAGALELAPDLSPAHRAAAGELRASVAAATERLHDVIGVLREELFAAAAGGDGHRRGRRRARRRDDSRPARRRRGPAAAGGARGAAGGPGGAHLLRSLRPWRPGHRRRGPYGRRGDC